MRNEYPDYDRENKEKYDFSGLCVFTSTKYGEDEISNIRFPLAIKMIENCNKLGIKTIVVDSSSNQGFLNKLEKIKNVEVIKSDEQLGKKRREALKLLFLDKDNKYFLRLEPEKQDLIKGVPLNDMIKEFKTNHANIVVPHRKHIEQMPKFFTWIEKRANKKVKEEILKSEVEYDLWFGPKMFDRKGAKYFLNYNKNGDETDLWDSHIKPVIKAYKDGLNIVSTDVDFKYDETEKFIESQDNLKKKRINQYNSILYEILK